MNHFAIIIVNYNTSDLTINCIESIQKNTSAAINYEIIVVDNSSETEDFNNLDTRMKPFKSENIQLVKSRYNSGFGGGNMFGVQFAKPCRFYAFINNDTLLGNDCLSIINNFFNEYGDAAICAPQQFNQAGEVQKSFDHFLSLKRELLGRSILEKTFPESYPKRTKVYNNPLKVQCVPGSFLVVKSGAFNDVGGFDTNIFLYYEETDLCFRIKKANNNGACYLVPEAKFVHLKGQSTKKNKAIKKELKRSLLYVLKKNSGVVHYQILRFWLTFKAFLKCLVKPKDFDMFLLYLKGAPMSESLKHEQSLTG